MIQGQSSGSVDPLAALPIAAAIPALREALTIGGAAVLQAPPGAGKTTGVPLALLAARWLEGRRMVMLEPRRLATRAAARQMARMLGEQVGETVGYRVRLESRVGPHTRIEVVTEGILTRMLLADPTLEDVGLVIFDEFHERSLAADLGLALALQTRDLLRPDMRLLVMSATLDGQAVARLLGGAPVIDSPGKAFAVDTCWRPPRPAERTEATVARVVREALVATEGDVLAFLPGLAEIRRTEALLRGGELDGAVHIHALHGSLPAAAQDAAISPSARGERKVVLATSIAETSLTIEGVRVVVDGGLARVPRFDPRGGMTRLETVRVSRAAADQRRGRAGRTAPGACYRLWSEGEDAHLLPSARPEIAETDLTRLALDLAVAGVADPAELRWLDIPPTAAFASARELLRELGALDAGGTLTAHGRRMAALPIHPRLAHMLIRGVGLGYGAVACDLGALLAERDFLRAGEGGADADVRLRLELLRDARALDGSGGVRGMTIDREGVRRVRELAREWRRQSGLVAAAGEAARHPGDIDAAGILLALAYPDRIGQNRGASDGRFLLRNGRGASLHGAQSLSASPFLVAAELDGKARESRIFLAAPVELADLEGELGGQVETEQVVEWDDAAGMVRAMRRERLGALVLRQAPTADVDPERVTALLVDVIRRRGAHSLPWDRASSQLRDRIRFAHSLDATWPDVSDETLMRTLDEWLAPSLHGVRRWGEVERLSLADALASLVGWSRRAELDVLAPSHWTVPTGSRIPIDYSDPALPSAAVRLQELFGLATTPTVGGGRVPLAIELLSPAQRPVQVTRDLAGFWSGSYREVRKELRGRYPRHHWPEDPLHAEPTRRARRRGE